MFEREYTINDVAELYHVCYPTVLGWIKSKKLEAIEHYGCRPLWTISEEALNKFDLQYVRRTDGKMRVIRQGRADDSMFHKEPIVEDSEEVRLLKGIKALSEILEREPALKELLLEMADRL